MIERALVRGVADRTTRGAAARLAAIVLVSAASSGCAVAAGIFRAGVWVGIVLAIVLILAGRMLFRGRR